MKEKHVTIPIFIPHKGCPFDCIYCNQKAISGQSEEMTEEKMLDIIKEHLETISEKTFVELAFFGGSFTGIPKVEQISFLKLANVFIPEKIKEIRLSTRPDYINEEILAYLKKYNVRTIELGVQSLDPEVLIKSNRGHTVETVYKASNLVKAFGFNLGIQTMIGLPGDTFEKAVETAKSVIGLKPQVVRIYPALVIKGTYLEKMYQKGSFKPLDIDEAVYISKELLKMYEDNGIRVIRIGLQPTDTIQNGMDVVAGPFHPAFRQLVEAKLALGKIEELIAYKGLSEAKGIVIKTGSTNISNVAGQKRENINYLKEKYGFKTVKMLEGIDLLNNIEIFELYAFDPKY